MEPSHDDPESGLRAHSAAPRAPPSTMHTRFQGAQARELASEDSGSLGAAPRAAGSARTGWDFSGLWTADNLRRGSVTLLIVQNFASFMLMREAKNPSSKDASFVPFSSAAAVVVQEVLKLLFALVVVVATVGHNSLARTATHLHEHFVTRWVDFLKLSIPGLLYTVQNNVIYVATGYLDAPTVQVLYQLKIITTALFSVGMLNRTLSRQQWVSLLLLFFGAAMVQISTMDAPSGVPSGTAAALASTDGSSGSWFDIPDSVKGTLAILVATLMSGLAGVYFEKVLKQSDTDLWTRNVQLGFFGLLFGLGGVWSSESGRASVAQHGFLGGFTPLVWIMVFNASGGGLLVAVVVKYADNIAKGFATSVSIILSALTTSLVLGRSMSALFFGGTTLVLAATFLYSVGETAHKAPKKPATPSLNPRPAPILSPDEEEDALALALALSPSPRKGAIGAVGAIEGTPAPHLNRE